MALVTSDQNMTVIILNNTEAEALANIFESFGRLMPELDELVNAMLGEKSLIICDANIKGVQTNDCK
tara:strand:+ start:719 stop:919 length:201 start_codon:yes stop_codon:yes gene_type:complete